MDKSIKLGDNNIGTGNIHQTFGRARTYTIKYPKKVTDDICNSYLADNSRENMEKIAERNGKTVREVIAKLTYEGIYIKPVKAKKKKDSKPKDIKGERFNPEPLFKV